MYTPRERCWAYLEYYLIDIKYRIGIKIKIEYKMQHKK